MGMKRDTAVRIAYYKICERERVSGLVLYPADQRAASEEKLRAMNEEADRIADEFMAYQAHHKSEERRLRLDELREQENGYREHFLEARDALMGMPAPDTEALLFKLEVAAISCEDDHIESCLADAKRLIGEARA
jgi:hypothetical protein